MKTFKFLPVVFVLCLAFTYVCCLPHTEGPYGENIPGHEHKEGCGHPFDKIKKGISTIAGKIKNATIAAKEAVVNTYKDITRSGKTKVDEHQSTTTDKGIPDDWHNQGYNPSFTNKYPYGEHPPAPVPTNVPGGNYNNHGAGSNGGRDVNPEVTERNDNGYGVSEFETGFQNAYGQPGQSAYTSTSENSVTELITEGGFNTGLGQPGSVNNAESSGGVNTGLSQPGSVNNGESSGGFNSPSQPGSVNNVESSVNRDPSLLDRQPTDEDVQAGIINPRIDQNRNEIFSSRKNSRQ